MNHQIPLAALLLITHEQVGEKMAGPGIRAWEIASALGRHGVDVTLATPYPSTRQAPNVRIQQYSWDAPDTLISLIDAAPVVMAAGPLLARLVHILGAPIDKPVIADIYDVVEIERIMHHAISGNQGRDLTAAILDEMYLYLRQGDYFICSNQKQFDLWFGALLAVGRINQVNLGDSFRVDHLLDIVPMGLPDQPPQASGPHLRGVVPGIEPEDKILYWGGGIWDWTDPFTLIQAMDQVLEQRQDVRLVFGALHHFDQAIVPGMSAAKRLLALVEQRGWIGRYVFFQDWIPYEARGSYLLEVDLGVSLNLPTVENRYAARARLMDYLWAGLPCVLSSGDELTALLAEVGLAKIVEPGDVRGMAATILTELAHSERQRELSLYHPSQSALFWQTNVKPILSFLQSPRKALDGDASREKFAQDLSLRRDWEELRQQWATLQDQNQDLSIRIKLLEQEVDQFRQRKAVQFADTLSGWLRGIHIKK